MNYNVGELRKELFDKDTRISELEEKVKSLQLLLDIRNYLINIPNKQKEQLIKEGWIDIAIPCTDELSSDCITRLEDLCKSEDGLCHVKLNLSRLC